SPDSALSPLPRVLMGLQHSDTANQTVDFFRDKNSLSHRTACMDQPDRHIVRTVGAKYLLSVTAIWNFLPPALARNRSGSTFFLRYHSHRHIQDLRRGTIVFFQRYEFKVTVFFLQLIKTFRICSPESVNRLIRIPDHKQFPS